jgi:hypothetical protein
LPDPLGLEIRRLGEVVFTLCPAIAFVHFNCVFNLGMGPPASEEQLDGLLEEYRRAGVDSFAIYHTPHCQPAAPTEWFASRKLKTEEGWDRICRDATAGAFPAMAATGSGQVAEVSRKNAEEWADFLDETYGLPTKPWLLALVERPGWHHYLLRQDGQPAAVRRLYLHEGQVAWMAIEAPVPGVMGPTLDLDVQLCQVMVRDALQLGARLVVADIEAPDPQQESPAYANFAAVGFRRSYFRSHYTYKNRLTRPPPRSPHWRPAARGCRRPPSGWSAPHRPVAAPGQPRPRCRWPLCGQR